MLGLMQDWPLTVDKILMHAAEWHPNREVVARSVEGPIVRTTYAALYERARRVSNALLALGVALADRVGGSRVQGRSNSRSVSSLGKGRKSFAMPGSLRFPRDERRFGW